MDANFYHGRMVMMFLFYCYPGFMAVCLFAVFGFIDDRRKAVGCRRIGEGQECTRG